MSDLKVVVVPRDLYYHEVAYVRGLESEVEQLKARVEATEKDRDYWHELQMKTDKLAVKTFQSAEAAKDKIIPDSVVMWDVALTAEELLELENGRDPKTIRPDHIVWRVPKLGCKS